MNSNRKWSLVTLMGIFLLALVILAGGLGAVQAQSAAVDMTAFLPFIIGAPPAAESYDTDFTEGIEPWAARRWSAGANYDLFHNNGCDGGHCGFLDLKVNNSSAYVIVSPAIPVDAPFTYKIMTRAKLLDRNDGDAYGIIFGGDRTGINCPAADFSTCFNEYYEFRVRYRDVNGDKFLEWKLKRVEGHDANNQNFGPDIIDWKRLDDGQADDWVKWEIEVHNNGQMYIYANNVKQAGSAKDSTYIHNKYFGLMGRTSSQGGSHVLFDTFRIQN